MINVITQKTRCMVTSDSMQSQTVNCLLITCFYGYRFQSFVLLIIHMPVLCPFFFFFLSSIFVPLEKKNAVIESRSKLICCSRL